MSKKDKIPLGVRLEFDDIDYWHKLPKNRYVTLPDGTKISEYEYMKRFMQDFYGKGFYDPSRTPILETEDQKKEARRNNNRQNRDAYYLSRKMGTLNALFQVERGAYDGTQEAWEKEFVTGTYNSALKLLLEQCAEELGIEFTKNSARVIMRIFFRIGRFVRILKRDIKTQKEQK